VPKAAATTTTFPYNIANFPKTLCDAGCHGRRRPQRFMDAHEIVIQREKRDRMRMVLNLFAETIRKPRKSARVHTNAEIGSLGK
jgi:hypothetical protein